MTKIVKVSVPSACLAALTYGPAKNLSTRILNSLRAALNKRKHDYTQIGRIKTRKTKARIRDLAALLSYIDHLGECSLLSIHDNGNGNYTGQDEDDFKNAQEYYAAVFYTYAWNTIRMGVRKARMALPSYKFEIKSFEDTLLKTQGHIFRCPCCKKKAKTGGDDLVLEAAFEGLDYGSDEPEAGFVQIECDKCGAIFITDSGDPYYGAKTWWRIDSPRVKKEKSKKKQQQ